MIRKIVIAILLFFVLSCCKNQKEILSSNISSFIDDNLEQLNLYSSEYDVHRDIMFEILQGFMNYTAKKEQVVQTLNVIKNKEDAIKIAEIIRIPSLAEKKRGKSYYVDALEFKNLWVVGFLSKKEAGYEDTYFRQGVYVIISRHTGEILMIWY